MFLPEVGGPALPIILSSCAFHRSKGIQLKWQEGSLRVSSAHREKMLPGASLKRMTWRASWLLPSEKRRQQAQSLAVAPGKGPRVTWPQVTEPPILLNFCSIFHDRQGIFLCGWRQLSHFQIRVPGTVRKEKTQGCCYHSETYNLLEGVPKSNIIFTMVSFWHLSEALKVTKLVCVVVISIFINFFLWLKRQKNTFIIKI